MATQSSRFRDPSESLLSSQIALAAYSSSAADSPVELDVTGAVVTALERNPDLVALRASEPVAQASLSVAQTYPFNPYVDIQVLPYGREREGGSTAVTNQVQILQTFERAHQQRHRVAGGIANLSRTQWTIAQSELQNVAQSERLFFSALYLRDLRDQAHSLAELNDRLVGITQRRFESGQATAADAATVRIESQSSRQQYELAEANYQTALLDLRRQLNLPLDVPLHVVGDLGDYQWLPAVDDATETSQRLLPESDDSDRNLNDDSDHELRRTLSRDSVEQLIANRPDVLAAREDVAAADAALALANADRVQNLKMGPMYERDDAGTLFFGIKSQVNIPVANNGMPLVRQRQAELQQKLVIAMQLEEKARLDANAAINRYERGRRLVKRASSQRIHDVPEQLQQFEDLFDAGQIDVLQLFTARTSLLQTRRAYFDSLKELALAAADVTAMTGLPPNELIDLEPGHKPEPMPNEGDAELLPSP